MTLWKGIEHDDESAPEPKYPTQAAVIYAFKHKMKMRDVYVDITETGRTAISATTPKDFDMYAIGTPDVNAVSVSSMLSMLDDSLVLLGVNDFLLFVAVTGRFIEISPAHDHIELKLPDMQPHEQEMSFTYKNGKMLRAQYMMTHAQPSTIMPRINVINEQTGVEYALYLTLFTVRYDRVVKAELTYVQKQRNTEVTRRISIDIQVGN